MVTTTTAVLPIWQSTEIRFDSPVNALPPRKGEFLIDSINSVEDTKGNNGQRGSLLVTNLRILWISHKNNRTNLSVGLGTVMGVNVRKAKSKLRGETQVSKRQEAVGWFVGLIVKRSFRVEHSIMFLIYLYYNRY